MTKKDMLLNAKYFLRFLPDKLYIRLYYRAVFKKKIDLENPKTFNEKLQWLKFNDRNPLYTKLVDKYEVREYIKKKIGEQYLVHIYGVWNKFEEIDFEKLPNQFVLKCTHDSGGIVICKDKSKLNLKEAKKKINKSLKRNFLYIGREWPYKDVKPRIIAEKYLQEENTEDLYDYKFMCFNGKVKCSFICSGRNKEEGLSVDFYDINWNKMPFERKYKNSKNEFEKPKNYEKMIELSEILSKEIPFVRVDFYEVNGKIYFGELTFYPGSGFEKFNPQKYDEVLGSWLELKDVNKNNGGNNGA